MTKILAILILSSGFNVAVETKDGFVERDRAIRELLATANEKLKVLRGAPASYANGQIYGFWSQTLANAYAYVNENSSGN